MSLIPEVQAGHEKCYLIPTLFYTDSATCVRTSTVHTVSLSALDGSLCINPLKSMTGDGLMINDKDTHGSEEGMV